MANFQDGLGRLGTLIEGTSPPPACRCPISRRLAYSSGVEARYLLYRTNTLSWRNFGAEVVAVNAPGNDLDFLTAEAGWTTPSPPPASSLWTDQRSDILRNIHWLH